MSRTAWYIAAILVVVAVIAGIVMLVLPSDSVVIPDVTGRTEAEARDALREAGLKVGGVTQAADPTVPVGLVVSQAPAAGGDVSEGSSVAFVVSTGP
jgi:eukaryotic-like serine/threonine-protein kinase